MKCDIGNPALRQWRAGGHYFSIADHHYFYRSEGQGPALLMVHGFPMSSWDWKDVLGPLSQNYRVIAPDFLGYGFSDKPGDGDYSTAAHARTLRALLETLNISEAHVLTYSFGCSVTQQLLCDTAGDDRLRIQSVTFMNGGLFPASNHPSEVQLKLLSPEGPEIAQHLTRSFLENVLPPIFGPNTQPSEQLITDYWELLNLNDGRLRLPRLIGYLRDRTDFASQWEEALIHHPAKKQLIVGTVDYISGPKMAEEYRAKVPNAHITVLDEIGHYPQVEAPEIVIKAVKEFAR